MMMITMIRMNHFQTAFILYDGGSMLSENGEEKPKLIIVHSIFCHSENVTEVKLDTTYAYLWDCALSSVTK